MPREADVPARSAPVMEAGQVRKRRNAIPALPDFSLLPVLMHTESSRLYNEPL